jgi:hypothetical protein
MHQGPKNNKKKNQALMCQLSDMFYSAVVSLAGNGRVKQRLFEAYSENLAGVHPDEVPDFIRTEFEALRAALYAVEPFSREDPVKATVRKMSSHQAGEHAASIVAMFGELVRARSTGDRLRLVSVEDEAQPEAGLPSYLRTDEDEALERDRA